MADSILSQQDRARMLERNLACLTPSSAAAIQRIRSAEPSRTISWRTSTQGAPTATITHDGHDLRLASFHDPIAEGKAWAQALDVSAHAGWMVLGMGLGYHIDALARKLKDTGGIFVFEPDVSLLRSLFENVDCTSWLGDRVVLLTDATARAEIASSLRDWETILGAGTRMLEHAPSMARIGTECARFGESFAIVMAAIRTNLVTVLLQTETTLRNVMHNLSTYAAVPGIADLHNTARGKPAIIVSGGPSLARNIEQLKRPEVREGAVIIAVQTVLKTLLAHGIKPHFVTALDHADISKRFYEGLSAKDVEGVTLVAEVKGSPAIFEAFPGTVRVPQEHIAQVILGRDLLKPNAPIRAGTTVAHLACYLARHMGCDPLILIGQDLAFTDGQYYSAGAAIHNVWAPELNSFNSLEMMEWQRIVRMRSILHTIEDHLGRPVFTDEQMRTYLTQFERDFAEDETKNLLVIDATEGGAAKAHTHPMTLADAIDRFIASSTDLVHLPTPQPHERRDRAIADRIRTIRRDIWQIEQRCERVLSILREMRGIPETDPRLNDLIDQAQAVGLESRTFQPAYDLVQFLNQTGALNRFKADRVIQLANERSPRERQVMQIDRDIINLRWLGDSARCLGEMFDETLAKLEHRKLRERPPARLPSGSDAEARSLHRVAAIVPVHTTLSGLGTHRDLAEPFLNGESPLRTTVRKLLSSKQLAGVVLLTHESERVRALVGDLTGDPRLTIRELDHDPMEHRRPGIRAGRMWAKSCWRGGLGHLTTFDECYAPIDTAAAMHEFGYHAVALVGADWTFVDIDMLDECILRYKGRSSHSEATGGDHIVFVHAPPGIGTCIIDGLMIDEAAQGALQNHANNTLGMLLGYNPFLAQQDPIAKPACVVPSALVRDLPYRCIPDSPARRELLTAAVAALPSDRVETLALAKAVRERMTTPVAPEEFTLELVDEHGTPVSFVNARNAIDQIAQLAPDTALTLGDRFDALAHPQWAALVAQARKSGIAAVHIRTRLTDAEQVEALIQAAPDVISIDAVSPDRQRYQDLTGQDLQQTVEANMRKLIELRGKGVQGVPTPWIAPRITRRDAVYEDIRIFFDGWLVLAGACIIDPLREPVEGERIAPLPLPNTFSPVYAQARATLAPNGQILDGLGHAIGNWREAPITEAWAPASTIEELLPEACLRA